jgi:hypothetical protein
MPVPGQQCPAALVLVMILHTPIILS